MIHETWNVFPELPFRLLVVALELRRKPGLYWIEIKPIGQLVPVN